MSSQQIRSWIKNSVNPETSKNFFCCLERKTPSTGVSGSRSFGTMPRLPDKRKKYHVFYFEVKKESCVKADGVDCIEDCCGWNAFGAIAPKAFVYIYSGAGIIIPIIMSYFIEANGSGAYVAIEDCNIPGIDIRKDRLFIRAIEMTSAGSVHIGKRKATGQDINSMRDMIEINDKKSLTIIINGRIVGSSMLTHESRGLPIDLFIDASISSVHKIEIDQAKTFLSQLHGCSKYILPTGRSGASVSLSSTEISIHYRAKGSIGVMIHGNSDKNINLITHRDISVASDLIMPAVRLLSMARSLGDFYIKITERSSGRDLGHESNRIIDLYRLDDQEIISILNGSGPDFWSASSLESSAYSMSLKSNIGMNYSEIISAIGIRELINISGQGVMYASSPRWRLEIKNEGVLVVFDTNGLMTEVTRTGAGYSSFRPAAAMASIFIPGRYKENVFDFFAPTDEILFEYTYSVSSLGIVFTDPTPVECKRNKLHLPHEGFVLSDGLAKRGESEHIGDIAIYDKRSILVIRVSINDTPEFIVYLDSTKRPLPKSPKNLMVFIAGITCIKNIDYIVSGGAVMIINTDYIKESISVGGDIVVIASGYQDHHKPNIWESGFVINNNMSHGNGYGIENSEASFYSSGGKILTESEISTEENPSESSVLENGQQYIISNSHIDLSDVPGIGDKAALSAKRIKEISGLIPQDSDSFSADNVIRKKINVYSPLAAFVISWIQRESEETDDFYHEDVETILDALMEASFHMVAEDFWVNNVMDERYVAIHLSAHSEDIVLSQKSHLVFMAYIEKMSPSRFKSNIIIGG